MRLFLPWPFLSGGHLKPRQPNLTVFAQNFTLGEHREMKRISQLSQKIDGTPPKKTHTHRGKNKRKQRRKEVIRPRSQSFPNQQKSSARESLSFTLRPRPLADVDSLPRCVRAAPARVDGGGCARVACRYRLLSARRTRLPSVAKRKAS